MLRAKTLGPNVRQNNILSLHSIGVDTINYTVLMVLNLAYRLWQRGLRTDTQNLVKLSNKQARQKFVRHATVRVWKSSNLRLSGLRLLMSYTKRSL